MPVLSLFTLRIGTAWLLALLLGSAGLAPAAASVRPAAPAVFQADESRGALQPVHFEHLWQDAITPEVSTATPHSPGPPVFLPSLSCWVARWPAALALGPAPRPCAVVGWFRQRMLLACLSPHAP